MYVGHVYSLVPYDGGSFYIPALVKFRVPVSLRRLASHFIDLILYLHIGGRYLLWRELPILRFNVDCKVSLLEFHTLAYPMPE